MRELTFDIPYIELGVYVVMLEDAVLPENKVSALRGGMGQVLLKQNCVSDRNCGVCVFQKFCPVTHMLYTYMENKPEFVTGKESVGYLIECENKTKDFKKGDRFVLCTDGFWGAMPEDEFIRHLSEKNSLDKVLDSTANIVESIGRNSGKEYDNLTAAILEINRNSILKEKMNKKAKIVIAILAILLIISVVLNALLLMDEMQTTF